MMRRLALYAWTFPLAAGVVVACAEWLAPRYDPESALRHGLTAWSGYDAMRRHPEGIHRWVDLLEPHPRRGIPIMEAAVIADDDLSRYALDYLKRQHSDAAAAALIRCHDHFDEVLRRATAAGALRTMLARTEVVGAIGECGGAVATGFITKKLSGITTWTEDTRDPREQHERAAYEDSFIWALRSLANEVSLMRLMSICDDASHPRRLVALKELAYIRDDRVACFFLGLLERDGGQPAVRHTAYDSLVAQRDPRWIPVMVMLASTPPGGADQNLREAIERLRSVVASDAEATDASPAPAR